MDFFGTKATSCIILLPYEAKILQMWKWTMDQQYQKCIRKPGSRYLGNYLMNKLKV